MAGKRTSWLSSRRFEAKRPTPISSSSRRLSFERFEPRAMLSASTQLEILRSGELTSISLADVDWSQVDVHGWLAKMNAAGFNSSRTDRVLSLLDSAADEGGLIELRLNSNFTLSQTAAGGQSSALLSFSDFPSNVGLGRSPFNYDSTLDFSGALDSDVGLSSPVTLPSVDLGRLDSNDLGANFDTVLDASGGLGSRQNNIFLVMQPSMQAIQTPAVATDESEGGAIPTPLRRGTVDSLAAQDATSASPYGLADSWESDGRFDGDEASDAGAKVRARAVALDVGDDGVLARADWRAAALARDAAFGALGHDQRKHAREGADADATPSEISRRGEARPVERDAAKNSDKIPAEDAAQATPTTGKSNAERAPVEGTRDMSQAPVGAASGEQAATTQRAGGEAAETPRHRLAAGLAALLVGGSMIIGRRGSTEPTAQHPPRRRET